jgi:hydroxymethylglutaryl-CoA lyase
VNLPNQATIIEVGPRDGLQNEKQLVPTDVKVAFIKHLKEAGIREIELTSFVSPKWIPQMKDAKKIIEACYESENRNLVLVPNRKGIDLLCETDCKNAAVFVGVSETFNKKNINKTLKESICELEPIIEELKSKDFFIRTCISTAFYCPYEGKINLDSVIELCKLFTSLGIDELSVADTIGMANPKESNQLFSRLLDAIGDEVMVAAHFHDTRGMALANILASLQAGVTRFDASAGGLGGCPFATGATGNVATEDVVYMFEQMGIKTGINLEKLLHAVAVVNPYISREIESKAYRLLKK